MYNSNDIANRIKAVVKEKGTTATVMLDVLDMGPNTIQNMKTSMPKADTLARIADYLEVSVDYLLGREQFIKTTPEKWSAILENMSNAELLQYLNVISYLLQERQHSQEV